MTKVEEMARAIVEHRFAEKSVLSPEDIAVICLKALLEPSEGMRVDGGIAIEKAAFEDGKIVFEAADDCFTAMIRHAIQEHEG